MITSAPGKIILFGEHAVVYGRHAIASAINLRCKVELRRSSYFRISSPIGVTGLNFEVHPYVSTALKRFLDFKKIEGAEIKISSDIPIAAGLGSSAAVTVATLKALNEEFNAGMDENDIFETARKVELDVQGRASGIDPFLSTYGGSWLFPNKKKLEINAEFFVIKIGERRTKDMVEKVARLKEKYPQIFEAMLDAIDRIAIEATKTNNFEDLIAMNQSLLRAIGVSNAEIDELIAKLEKMGLKAKITGAGGGGCIFGIYKGVKPEESFIVKTEKEGVRVESP